MTTPNGAANGTVKFPDGYTAAQLMSMQFPPPRWAVPGIIAHGLCLLGGMPKVGKSWLCHGLGQSVAKGGAALGQVKVDQGEVLYLALEDDWESLQERISITTQDGSYPENFHIYNSWPRMGKERGTNLLNEWLDQHPNCRLVMIDTLPAIRPIGNTARTLFDDDYQTASALKTVADRHKVAIVAVMHLTKMQRDDPFLGFNATLGLTGGADQMIVVAAGTSQTDAVMHVKGRRVRWQQLALRWDAQLATWNLMGKADDFKRRSERKEIRDCLLSAPLPLTPREVSQIIGKKESTVRSLMWQMQRDKELSSVDGRYKVVGVAKLVSESGNSGNVGNVAEVGQVAIVAEVARVADLANAMPCLDCGQPLMPGWYFRCPLCEEKHFALTGELSSVSND